MSSDFSTRLDRHFASLADPRRGKVTYPLINIVAIAVCATIAGADDFVAIADWARQKKDWLAEFLDRLMERIRCLSARWLRLTRFVSTEVRFAAPRSLPWISP